MITDKVIYGFILFLIMLCIGLKYQVSSLKDELSLAYTNLELKEQKNISLNNSIKEQNSKIEKYRLDIDVKEKKYLELVSKPEKIRYKTIYKTIPNIGVKSNECEDIKKLIDDIRSNGY